MATAPAQAPAALRITRTFPAPREKVFRAWTEGEKIARWLAPSEDFTTAVPALDPRPGGRYHIEMRREGRVHSARGVFREVTPPERLVLTWTWDPEPGHEKPGETLLTLEFLDRDGSTELVLTHERFENKEQRDDHEKGWSGCLGRLQKLLESEVRP